MKETQSLLFESLEPLTVGRFYVRVWRQEKPDITEARFDNADLDALADKLVDCDNAVVIAREFAKVDRVNAVEVADSNRRAVLAYVDWP